MKEYKNDILKVEYCGDKLFRITYLQHRHNPKIRKGDIVKIAGCEFQVFNNPKFKNLLCVEQTFTLKKGKFCREIFNSPDIILVKKND